MLRLAIRRVSGLLLAMAVLAPSTAAGATVRPETSVVYGGVGSWVDIFAKQAWRNPDGAVASLRSHGVRTLYLQTSNYSQASDVVDPPAVGRFIDAAHAAGLKVVAWYLPSLADPALDHRRALAAIRFRSTTDQSFDSFALDIEASVVRNVQLRNARLIGLVRSLRAAAPPAFPLGAIVPSPVGMRRHPHYWPRFPFAQLAETFDVFVPMAYFSYYAKSSAAAYAYVRDVVIMIRRASGKPELPIHVIGGIANRAGIGAVDGFLRAARDCGVAGISLYAFLETSPTQWSHLGGTPLGAPPTPSCSR